MTFDEYDETVLPHYPGAGTFLGSVYCTGALNEEAGEAFGKIKKAWRDNDGVLDQERYDGYMKELGDTLWYLSASAQEVGASLEEVARYNIEKLKDRRARGVIQGEGDDR